MQNPIPKLGRALLFPRNQAICLENWKLWRAPATKFKILAKFCHLRLSGLPMSTKDCLQFFYFVWILSDLQKLKKVSFLHNHRNQSLQTLLSRKRVQKFIKKC